MDISPAAELTAFKAFFGCFKFGNHSEHVVNGDWPTSCIGDYRQEVRKITKKIIEFERVLFGIPSITIHDHTWRVDGEARQREHGRGVCKSTLAFAIYKDAV
ncbi:hypothetical protein Nepgr_001295 [Nepenthes gracilis]|uniref:Uncharacterized protein n=1 Tax=Nepenthes gracilis TaxID=150966 RepID=A0AAD3P459_NEPGR|nr:hypothetical protein Nepgr_001295 [Nepenthes gracilis]